MEWVGGDLVGGHAGLRESLLLRGIVVDSRAVLRSERDSEATSKLGDRRRPSGDRDREGGRGEKTTVKEGGEE